MTKQTVAFLGPLGTYSHLVARKRFAPLPMIPLSGILDVCTFVSKNKDALGVIPIENSSGGTINETVDILLDNKPAVHIIEELSLDVKLAQLGHKGFPVKRLYSHFVPLAHCAPWIAKNLKGVEKREAASTAAAAAMATADLHAASLGSRNLATQFGLDIIHFPVATETPNITTFIVISRKKQILPRSAKTTLAIHLQNRPGSLYRFLGILHDEGINLSRLVSRPIRGVHQEYAFLVDLDGAAESPAVVRALRAAAKQSVSMRICGSYPCHKAYKS
jgi:chorismate mutase/prephenate dehydratase